MTNSAVRTAVDHLLAQKASALPNDIIEWQEVKTYHRAYLAAAQVRAEFAIFLMDAWQRIWQPAILSSHLDARYLTPKEQTNRGYDPQSPQAIWDDGTHYRTFTVSGLSDIIIDTGVTLEPEGLSLSFACWGPTDITELSDHLVLPNSEWLPTPKDGWRISHIAGEGGVERLQTAAESALRQIRQLVQM